MTVLTESQILDCMDRGLIKLGPGFSLKALGNISVDLALGFEFVELEGTGPVNIMKPSNFTKKVHRLGFSDVYHLEPGGFVLATTRDYIELDTSIMARVDGKSRLARLGLTIHQTAGRVDPGFRGHLVLEISNAGPLTLELVPNAFICALTFERVNPPPTRYQGRYNNQENIDI